MRSTSTPGWRRSKAKKRKVSAKSTAQSIPSAQAIQLAARVLLSPTPRPCPFAPSVTTPHYSTTVSQALRQPLRSRRSRANFRECPERELRFNGVLRSSPRKLPQIVYLGDAVPTVGLVGWSLLSNGVGLIALLPRGRVNHRDR